MPERIQRKRTKGWRMPEGAVYVGRPTKWGNHIKVERAASAHGGPLDMWTVVSGGQLTGRYDDQKQAAAEAVARYRRAAEHELVRVGHAIREELGGKDLACWCPLDWPCHADVLLKIANELGEAPHVQ